MRMRFDISLTYSKDSDVDQAKKRHLNSGQMQRDTTEKGKGANKNAVWRGKQLLEWTAGELCLSG